MIESGLVGLIAIPAGLGLIGFVEPCSIGAGLVFIKAIEARGAAAKVVETMLFALTRATVIGGLGAVAALTGQAFEGVQRGGWIALGALYAGLGLILIGGRGGAVMAGLGPSLRRLQGAGGSAGLGALFGLNVPACAAPLLIALLGGAAAGGGAPLEGFVALGVFGLALSLPLVVLVLLPRTRGLLARLAGLSRAYPLAAGLVLLALGLWSVAFALVADPALNSVPG
jgi:cytochrome c-type biogenesis protein